MYTIYTPSLQTSGACRTAECKAKSPHCRKHRARLSLHFSLVAQATACSPSGICYSSDVIAATMHHQPHCHMQNKKFELMLTRRVKAYSSSCSQTVSLSPAISSQFILAVCAAAKDRKNQ